MKMLPPTRSVRRARLFGPVLMLLLLGLAGCGRSEGTVTGRISYQGKPLGNGRVMFISQKDPSKLGASNIESDGTYTVVGVPVGPATVTVETYPLPDRGGLASGVKGANPVKLQSHMNMPKPPAGGGTYVKIPDKYKAKETAGLVYDVKPGKQTHDFDLQ